MSRKSSLLIQSCRGSSSAVSSRTLQSSSYFRQPSIVRACSSKSKRTSVASNHSSAVLNFQIDSNSRRMRCQFGSFSKSSSSSSPMTSTPSSSAAVDALAKLRPRPDRRRVSLPPRRTCATPARPCKKALSTAPKEPWAAMPKQRGKAKSANAVQAIRPARRPRMAWLDGLLTRRPRSPIAKAWLRAGIGVPDPTALDSMLTA
mmetsp:Transcript_80479/g.180053  ORF Transcript_80479/g.180053 Transcript_80479/m.180053 type:complete len:203 (-) Transcript_80479:34-642(-)